MFTWLPIHTETAKRLLKYENRQLDLIRLIKKMAESGLNVIPIADHPTKSTTEELQEIDPFTFLAVFNRQITLQNRVRLWRFLKAEWKLDADVPSDAHGVPTITPQNSWFFTWKHSRRDEDIPLLWELAKQALSPDAPQSVPASFGECLGIHAVGVGKLTTGLYWIAPDRFLPLPVTTTTYLEANQISMKVDSADSYARLMIQVREKLSINFVQESHRAWVHCQSAEQADFAFDETQQNAIWAAFTQRNPTFENFENPGEKFEQNELSYKRAGLGKFEKLGGRSAMTALLASGKAAEALEIVTKSVELNIASYLSWRPSFGSENPDILSEVLQAFLSATEGPYEGVDTLLPIFDAIERNGLKTSWDTLSVTLWALRPEDYFPIKISYYRSLSEKLDCPLPKGRPNAARFDAVRRFGKAFWQVASKASPRDWVDVQSFLWDVCQGYGDPTIPDTKSKQIWLLAPGEGGRLWDEFREKKIAAIGWDFLGDLSEYQSKEEIQEAIQKQFDTTTNPSNDSLCCWQFAHEMKTGDLIVTKAGRSAVLGVGRVISDYFHEAERQEYDNCRTVDWVAAGRWEMEDKFPTKTLTDITPYPDFVLRILDAMGQNKLAEEVFGVESPRVKEVDQTSYGATDSTNIAKPFDRKAVLGTLFMPESAFDHMLDQLARKKNIILQGPPGVGKTFVARTLAYALMGFEDDERVDMVQFHQSYGYEEFVQGLRPTANGTYVLRDGVFHLFCQRAQQDERDHFFIIDEINRGNLSKILGEIMMLIERDKRRPDYAMPLAYSDPGATKFFVPPNVHIIGLMNTADRSLAMVDYALRRRFAFVALKPEFESPKFKNALTSNGMEPSVADALISGIGALNKAISVDQMDLGSGFCVGHSYFCPDGPIPNRDWIHDILDFEILPLLQEYWIESPERADKEIEKLKQLLP